MPAGFITKGVTSVITGIHHVRINVHDIVRAVRFYLDLGLPVIPLSPTTALVLAPNAGILLIHVPDAALQSPEVHALGWRHLCLQVPTMARTMASCNAHAMMMLSQPVDLRTGHLYVYGRDIDNTLIEIEEVPYTPYLYPSWLGHIACVSADLAQLKQFYVDFIGGEVVDPGVIGPNPAYDRVVGFTQTRLNPVWIKRLNLTIELWQFINPPSPPRMNHTANMLGYQSIALISDAIDADAQRCIALGGTLINASATHMVMQDCDQNRIDIYTPDDPFIRTCGAWLHPTLLHDNAKHWRPRPELP
jgi:catechol 2,3-dioxygenase-like lactoylglutathione lyase family enzyme